VLLQIEDIGNFAEEREAFGVCHGFEALEQNTSYLLSWGLTQPTILNF